MNNIRTRDKKRIFDKPLINAKNAPYYFLSPIIILFVIFMFYPIVSSVILSFQEFNGGKYIFVGLNNYLKLFKDPVFKAALINTFWYLLIQVPVMVVIALIMAVLLNMKFLKIKGFFRVSIFLPAVTALVAYSLIFKLMLNTNFGIFNYIFGLIHIPPVDWLNGGLSSKASIIIAMTWRWTGYNMVILLAGLQNISPDIYEACDIDGANSIQRFFKVTIPLMKPIILFCTITSTIGTLQIFDESFILTKGGPDNATISISHYLYNTGFRFMKFGYASAISYVLVIIIAVFSLIQFKVAGEED